MAKREPAFDPVRYKQTTHEQWEAAAEAWHRWRWTLARWLGPATRVDAGFLGAHGAGKRVLDVAAGAGDQTLAAARRVGPSGYVLATDFSASILQFAAEEIRKGGLENVETRVMDGENLHLPNESFDAVISRVGLIYFPDQQKALTGMRGVLKPGGRIAAIVYSTPERNGFFSVPISVIRRRAQLPPPVPGQPGPFSLGGTGVLEAALRQAGFVESKTHLLPAPLRMSSAAECLQFERESFGALHQMLAGLALGEREEVWRDIEHELGQFEGRSGFEGPCRPRGRRRDPGVRSERMRGRFLLGALLLASAALAARPGGATRQKGASPETPHLQVNASTGESEEQFAARTEWWRDGEVRDVHPLGRLRRPRRFH